MPSEAPLTTGMPRVLHLNDVANVGSTLVAAARDLGRDWVLRDIPHPQAGHPWRSGWERAIDLPRFWRERRDYQVLHIHYGSNGYYAFGARQPFVLHIHGSDFRVDLHQPLIGALERKALQRADAVLYSTPDLGEGLREIRPDAQYFPNPLPLELVESPPKVAVESGKVFCNFRFDDTKGGRTLIAEIGKLVRDGVAVHGLDWGIYAADARQVGVVLHPLAPLPDFLTQLASAEVVIGQHWLGTLGMSDLQTLALGRPLVAYATDASIPMYHCEVTSLVSRVHEALSSPQQAATIGWQGREWALAHHNPRHLVKRLEELYDQLLTTKHPTAR